MALRMSHLAALKRRADTKRTGTGRTKRDSNINNFHFLPRNGEEEQGEKNEDKKVAVRGRGGAL